MATFKGQSGKISIKKTTTGATEQFLAHISSWSLDSSLDIDQASYFGGSKTEEGSKESTPGSIGWTASVEGAIDLSATSGQDDLFDAHNDATELEFLFYLDSTTAFKGKGYIDGYSPSHAADGKAEFSATVSGNGKLSQVTV